MKGIVGEEGGGEGVGVGGAAEGDDPRLWGMCVDHQFIGSHSVTQVAQCIIFMETFGCACRMCVHLKVISFVCLC